MRLIAGVLSIAALMWVDVASAQKTYSVSVSHHRDAPLSEAEVRRILADASKMLQKNSRHNGDDDFACNVTLTLKDPVRTFGSPNLPAMVDKDHIDAVHRVDSDVGDVDFHVKVVKKITNFCRVSSENGFHGCSYPPNFRSMIVEHPTTHTDPVKPDRDLPEGKLPDHLLWAHEFGHVTGLGHRDKPLALMTPCDLSIQFSGVSDARVQVTRRECRCMLSGVGACPLPDPLQGRFGCRRPQ